MVIAIYGGTSWSKVEGRFLLGTSSSYAVNSIGGEAAHTLTTAEMPSHNHASSTKKGAIPCWDNKASSTGKYYGLYDGSLAYQSSYAYDINTTSTSYAGGNQNITISRHTRLCIFGNVQNKYIGCLQLYISNPCTNVQGACDSGICIRNIYFYITFTI